MISVQVLNAATSSIASWLSDGSGNVLSSTSGSLNVNITGGGGGSVVDSSAWTAATSTFVPNGGVFNDSAAALTSGQQGTFRATNNRGLHVSLRTQAGVAMGDTLAHQIFVQGSDGTNTQSYLATGEAKVSVTQALPAGANSIGTVVLGAGAAAIGSVIVAQPGTAALTQVTPTTSSATLVAANANRKGVIVDCSDVTKDVYIAFAATASASAYTYHVAKGNVLDLQMGLAYNGLISVIGLSGISGSIKVTDLN